MSVPRMRLASSLGQVTAGELLEQLHQAQDVAMATVSGEESTQVFNSIVERANAVRDQLASSSGPPSREIQQQSAAVIADFNRFAETGVAPAGQEASSRPFPWAAVGIGALALGGLWLWANGQREALEDLEDCGCDG